MPTSSLADRLLYTALFHMTKITHCSKATEMLQKQWGRNKIAKRWQKLWLAENHVSRSKVIEETIVKICSLVEGETDKDFWEPEMQISGYLHIFIMEKGTSKLLEQFVCISLSKITHIHKLKKDIWKAQLEVYIRCNVEGKRSHTGFPTIHYINLRAPSKPCIMGMALLLHSHLQP